MKLIVGLGNPGAQYARTRHNIGFMVADDLARELGANWQAQPKFKAEIAVVGHGDDKLILLKPQTFMNLSGEAIRAVFDFYKIDPTDIWVIFDDLDTPFGRLRVRRGGSGSGHQGVNSTIAHLGDQFLRFKVGISMNNRDVEPSEVYVLKPFNEQERGQLPDVITGVARTIQQCLVHEPEASTFALLPPSE